MQKNYPKITVVTCTHNRDTYLEKALNSVENQTYKNIQHVINDSSDRGNSKDIIKQYIKRNKDRYEIKLIHAKPKGIANALNVATQHANGDVIHYLHDDDYYIDVNVLSKIAGYFKKDKELVWVTGDLPLEIKGRIVNLPITRILETNPKKALDVFICISHENTFVKTEAVKQYGGFDEDNKRTIEYRLWVRMIQEHLPLIKHEAYTVFIVHNASMSSGSPLSLLKGSIELYKTQLKEKMIPIIGHYEEKAVYKKFREISEKIDLIRKISTLNHDQIEEIKQNGNIDKIFEKKNSNH